MVKAVKGMKNKKNPLVSIIIPTYNRAHLLPRAIESVLSQNFRDFELVIVDDGSTDDTKEIIKKFQERDNRIKYIWQKNSGGPASPKNTGIKDSSGKYIAFLDDDDEWFSEKLEKQINLFEKNKQENIGIIACNSFDFYEESNTIIEYKIRKRKNYFQSILSSCFIRSCSSVVIRKDVLKVIGFFDENLKITDDWDMWIRIINKYNFSFVEKSLFRYHIHSKNASKKLSGDEAINEHFIIFNKHSKYYVENPKIYSDKLRYDGTRHMLSFKKKDARILFLKSIKKNPLNIKSYIYFFISFFGVNIYKKMTLIKKRISSCNF